MPQGNKSGTSDRTVHQIKIIFVSGIFRAVILASEPGVPKQYLTDALLVIVVEKQTQGEYTV